MGNWFKSDQSTQRITKEEMKEHELDYGDLFMRYLKEKKHNENGDRNQGRQAKRRVKRKSTGSRSTD